MATGRRAPTATKAGQNDVQAEVKAKVLHVHLEAEEKEEDITIEARRMLEAEEVVEHITIVTRRTRTLATPMRGHGCDTVLMRVRSSPFTESACEGSRCQDAHVVDTCKNNRCEMLSESEECTSGRHRYERRLECWYARAKEKESKNSQSKNKKKKNKKKKRKRAKPAIARGKRN